MAAIGAEWRRIAAAADKVVCCPHRPTVNSAAADKTVKPLTYVGQAVDLSDDVCVCVVGRPFVRPISHVVLYSRRLHMASVHVM